MHKKLSQRLSSEYLTSIFFSRKLVKVKWGKETFDQVDVNTDEEPMLFKAQLFALTGVQPQSQKVMLKGALLKDDPSGWNALKPKLKNGVTLLMMGTKDEDALVTLKESEKPQVTTALRVIRNKFTFITIFFHIISLTKTRSFC